MTKKWIQKAVKRPGALRNAAKRAGAVTKKGTIKKAWLRQQAKKPGRRGRQARLALTLSKMKRKKR
jgi:hypothetical protein